MQLKFSALVRQRYALDKPAAAFLSKMLEDHPYCQPARFLYAKTIKDADSRLFQEAYNKALVCAPDRKVFREFISTEILDSETTNYETVNSPSEHPSSKPSEADHTVDTAVENIEDQDPKNELACSNRHAADTEQEIVCDDTKSSDPEEKTLYQQRIIDRFLEKEPRIEISKEGGQGGDLSRSSIEDNPDLASETLAEILLKQGKKERAILIYKKLMLVFPEKSSYFAKKLENIN